MRVSPDLIARAMRVPRPVAAAAKDKATAAEPVDRATFVASLAARRDAAATGLNEAKALRQKAFEQAIAATLDALRQQMTGKPAVQQDALVVRVLGTRRAGDATRRAPLAGVLVRLGVDEKNAVEAETDLLGVAALEPPAAPRGETLELQVLAPDRTVVSRRKMTEKELKGLALTVELAESAPLAAAFAAAERWIKAEDAAVKRAAELRALAAKALPRLEAELKTMADALGRAVDAVPKAAAPTELRRPQRGASDKPPPER